MWKKRITSRLQEDSLSLGLKPFKLAPQIGGFLRRKGAGPDGLVQTGVNSSIRVSQYCSVQEYPLRIIWEKNTCPIYNWKMHYMKTLQVVVLRWFLLQIHGARMDYCR